MHPVCRRGVAVRARQPAVLDRRTSQFPVPVAVDAGHGCGAATRRPYATDNSGQLGAATHRTLVRGSCVTGGDRFRARGAVAGRAIPGSAALRGAYLAADFRWLPRHRHPDRHRPCRCHRAVAADGDHDVARLRPGGAHRRRYSGIAVGWAAGAALDGVRQPDRILCLHRGGVRDDRCADRVRLRHRHDVVSRLDQCAAVVRGGEPHGRRHVEPAAVVCADVRIPRAADGDGRHRARDGGVPRGTGGACARRAVIRAAGRDYLVSGISGSKAADMAAVAPVLFPEMRRRGSHPGELAALLASSSAMSETIPPSLVLITIGSVANVSITALFTGGLLPAAVAAVALLVMSWYRSRHMDISGGERASAGQIVRTFVIAVPGLTLPFVIRAAVIDGVATATEVSTVGVVYTALLGILCIGSSIGGGSIRSWSTRCH